MADTYFTDELAAGLVAGSGIAITPDEDTLVLSTGWTQIGTLSPSTATDATFTSIPSTYSDLLLVARLTPSTSQQFRIEISADSVSWSGAMDGSTSLAAIFTAGVEFLRYNGDYGIGVLSNNAQASSPDVDRTAAAPISWLCTGGIDGIRATPSTGTFTGTVTLYGR